MEPRLSRHECTRAFAYYPALKRVEEYVHTHMDAGISLRQAACVARLGPKYFSHFFRKKVGLTFTEWVAAQRVARAATMFQEQDHSVSNVAETVGLRNRRTCERWFKRFTGMTPHQFKRAARPS
jgi:AraC family transcriptional regulator